VKGAAQEFAYRGCFKKLTGVHDRNAVAENTDDAQVVRDEENSHAGALFDFAQQFKDLSLNGDIEGSGRLIRHKQPGFRSKGHGEHHPLLHAAGHFKRVLPKTGFGGGDANELKQTNDLCIIGMARTMQLEHFFDLSPYPEDGVQGGCRVLKNVANYAPAELSQLGFGHLQDIVSIEQDLATRVPGRGRWKKARNRKGGGTFAAATLADEANGLACLDGQRDSVDCPELVLAGDEIQDEVLDLQQGHSKTK
jgi:hypothetical protein